MTKIDKLKILISHDSGAHFYDRMGFLRVLNYSGYDCVLWNIQDKSAFDIFSEFEPDIFFGQLHNIDRATYKNIVSRPNLKVALKAGHWGAVDKDIDTKKYPVLVATDEHKRMAELLVKSGNLKYVFVHYHENSIPYTMGSWNNIVKPVSIMNAYDPFIYDGGEVKDEFKCDLSIISGYWPYKAQNLNKYILPLCEPLGKHNIRIYGNSHWPVPQYMGPIDESNARHIFRSTKINLDCHEPHSEVFGFDVTERFFKVSGAGGFYLSLGRVSSLEENLLYYPNSNLFPNNDFWNQVSINPCETDEIINYWLTNKELRIQKTENLQKFIISKHTYFDRVALALDEFKIENEVLKNKEKYFDRN